MGLSAIGRTILHLLSSALAVLVLGVVVIRPDSKNRVALHGLAGLFVGAVLSFAIFSDGFFADLLLVSLGLSGPILGAISGLAVGFAPTSSKENQALNFAVLHGAFDVCRYTTDFDTHLTIRQVGAAVGML